MDEAWPLWNQQLKPSAHRSPGMGWGSPAGPPQRHMAVQETSPFL